MQRRQFIGASAATLFTNIDTSSAQTAGDETQKAFLMALEREPWLRGFVSAQEYSSNTLLKTEGHWPKSLSGAFYRNGPSRHDFAGQRYHHLFDGDGMVHRYAIKDGHISYHSRFILTQKYIDEQSAGRFLYDTAGTMIGGPGIIKEPDNVNTANINLLSTNDALWTLWEAGSPYDIDPTTLETRGIVSLSPELRGAPFSAHPRKDVDGKIWNFGVFGSRMALYRLDATAKIEKFNIIDIDPVGMVHDFFLTEKSMVIILPSSDMQGNGESYFGSIRPRPDKPMQVLIADRDTLEIIRRAELPSGFWFHGGNAWESSDGTLHFDINLLPDARALQSFRTLMRGQRTVEPYDIGVTTRFSLSPKGRYETSVISGEVEFPRIDPRVSTLRNRYIFSVERHDELAHWFDAVRRVDLETGAVDRYAYGTDYLVEEHVFVPRAGSGPEGEGWLLGTALHWPTKRTCLSLFDAKHIPSGPIARAWVPMAVPLGLHGQFVQSAF